MKQEEMLITTAAHSVIFSLMQLCFSCREREEAVYNIFFFLLKYPLLVHNADQQFAMHTNHC